MRATYLLNNIINESITLHGIANITKWAKLISTTYGNVVGEFLKIQSIVGGVSKSIQARRPKGLTSWAGKSGDLSFTIFIFDKLILAGVNNSETDSVYVSSYAVGLKFKGKQFGEWIYDAASETFTAGDITTSFIPTTVKSVKNLMDLIVSELEGLPRTFGDDMAGDPKRLGLDMTQDRINAAMSTPERRFFLDLFMKKAKNRDKVTASDSRGNVYYFAKDTAEAEMFWSLRPYDTEQVACETVRRFFEKEVKNLSNYAEIDDAYEMLYGMNPVSYTHKAIEDPAIINIVNNYVETYYKRLKERMGSDPAWNEIEIMATWSLKVFNVDKEATITLPQSELVDTYMDAVREIGQKEYGQDSQRKTENYAENFIKYLSSVSGKSLDHAHRRFQKANKEILKQLEGTDFQLRLNKRGQPVFESKIPFSAASFAKKYYKILIGANVVFSAEEICYLVPLAIAINKRRKSDIYSKLVRKYGRVKRPIVDYSALLFDDLSLHDKNVRSLIDVLLRSIVATDVTAALVTESIIELHE